MIAEHIRWLFEFLPHLHLPERTPCRKFHLNYLSQAEVGAFLSISKLLHATFADDICFKQLDIRSNKLFVLHLVMFFKKWG